MATKQSRPVGRTVKFAWLLVAASMLQGCTASFKPGIRGSGNVVAEARTVPEFSSIDFRGSASVRVVPNQPPQVIVTCDDNLLPFIKTEVSGGCLEIHTTKSISPTEKFHFEIQSPALTRLVVAGSGAVTVEPLATDTFELEQAGSGATKLASVTATEVQVKAAGSGGVRISGEVDSLTIKQAGSGRVDAKELVAKTVNLRAAGSGSIHVHASESFQGTSSGSGAIHCRGNPAQQEHASSGSGGIFFE